ncbi:uncharacterized protein JCM10292_004763 [Rhodotorula paludigena]|uniref:uncharacterized protein n=1 Tax=Rhodotorula paludigena TaxID=86838 RepID=UPI003181D1AE
MLLVENALSEELPDSDSAAPSRSRTAPPPLQRHAPAQPAHQPDTRATDYDKMLAACIGAVLTSLTMTPFDVIKTRLQTQAPRDPAFTPSPHRLPRSHPLATSPWPPPVASTSSAPPPPPPPQTGAAAAKPAVCCNTKSYFNANAVPASSSAHTAHHAAPASSDRSLLCRFDPRVARASLPGTGAHAVSTAPHQYLHNLAASASPALALSSAPASSESIAACLYPSSAAAPMTHATVSLPFATTHSASFSPSSAPPSASAPPARHLTGFTDALVHIVRAEGATALWRGTGPALAMSVPGQVIYMVGYDWLRRTAFAHPPAWAQQRQGGGAYTTLVPLVAGSASRTVVAALLSPFELVRTRLQSQTPASRAPPLAALVRELRWSNAWRGLSSTLWRDVPFSGVYWAGYEAIKRGLTGGRGMGEARRAGVGARAGAGADESKWGEFAVAFVSGAGSGMIAATLTNPFDVIKTRRQALFASPSPSPSSSSSAAPAIEEVRTWPILRSIVQQEGYRGLWAGLTPRLAKVGPACGLMIGCYEAISSLSAAKLHAAAQPNDRQDGRTGA